MAVAEGYTRFMHQLLAAGVDPNGQCDGESGWTALMEAASDGQQATGASLLSAGADVNLQTKPGYTALIWAAAAQSRGHPAVVERLLAAHADPHLRTEYGKTALDLAEYFLVSGSGKKAVIQLLRAATRQTRKGWW